MKVRLLGFTLSITCYQHRWWWHFREPTSLDYRKRCSKKFNIPEEQLRPYKGEKNYIWFYNDKGKHRFFTVCSPLLDVYETTPDQEDIIIHEI